MRLFYLLAIFTVFGFPAQARESQLPKIDREELGRDVKLKILVDKTMQPEEEWVTKEWMIRETAEAGFNAFSPRRGHDRLDEVRQVTRWCEKYGIYHMPWMRGSLRAPGGSEADGRRVVWASGSEQPLWSPNADEFWRWTSKYIIAYAKISVELPHLMGVFLDYENYSPGGHGNLYSLSYDDIIMRKFGKAKDTTIPKLELDKRRQWLEQQKLHEDFETFQVAHWRERCTRLRTAVDKVNPQFQFCVYPAPGTKFMLEAVYPEWGTEKAPLILADPSTYGRSSRTLPQVEALKKNREKLIKRRKTAIAANIPFVYAGGIDPVVTGADPEFSGKNAVMISETTDGYWVFYEGVEYNDDHPDYFKWFTWANEAIVDDDFDVWREPRRTPEDWSLKGFKRLKGLSRLIPPEVIGEKVELPKVKLRGENFLLLAVKAGHQVEVVIQEQPIADYRSCLIWDLRTKTKSKIKMGKIAHGERGVVTFTPETDDIYVLGISTGQCACSLVSTNAPVGLYAGGELHFIQGPQRLYFMVPQSIKKFSLTAQGSGSETARVNVYNPDGELVATGQTIQGKTEIKVTAGDHAGKIWSLTLTEADQGRFEDHWIQAGPALPPSFSLVPKHVFGVSRKR
jgi:hypothetical protein